jgi:tetratricopeptide (TPR) repeat protein
VIDNVSYFKNCTFVLDSANLLALNGLSFTQHVRLWGVRGIQFDGCTFENQTTRSGKAIFSEDAGFNISYYCDPNGAVSYPCNLCIEYTPSIFKGFAKAIDVVTTGQQYNIEVDHNTYFKNNGTGISITGNNYAAITRSEFDLNPYGTGIFLNDASGYKIEENEFYKDPGNSCVYCTPSVGINVNNSGVANNLIYRNNFSLLDCGISASGINGPSGIASRISGLEFQCNEFSQNINDIKVNSGQVKTTQGTLLKGADNQFSNTVNSSFINNGLPVTYYHSPGGNHAPVNVSSSVSVINSAGSNNCISTLCSGPEPVLNNQKLLDEYGNLQEEYDNLLNNFISNNYDEIIAAYQQGNMPNPEILQTAMIALDEIVVLGDKMSNLSDETLRSILSDSVLKTDYLESWYSIVRTPIAKYSLAETHFMTGDYEKADAVLQKIPEFFGFNENEKKEHENYCKFHAFKKQLQLSGRNWTELKETDITELQSIAEATSGRSASMAQGVLCFFYDICYDEKPDVLIPSKKEILQNTMQQSQNQQYELTIYPNPTHNEVTVSVNNPLMTISRIEIFDIFGRVVLSETANVSSANLNINSLPNSVYLMKISMSNGNVEVRKLVKM